jgi:hypothetical protein
MKLARVATFALLATVTMALASCDSAVARTKGVVSSVQPGAETQICLKNTVDAGSTYGDKSPRAEVCATGIVQGPVPQPGDCIILRTQGESSDLTVTPGKAC